MRIVLPYVGSKLRFFNTLKHLVPENSLYIEPFAGGYSLGLNLIENGFVTNTILNDTDKQVTDFWSIVKEDYWSLAQSVDDLILLYQSLDLSQDVETLKVQLDKTAIDKVTTSALYYIYRKMNLGTARRGISTRGLDFGQMLYTQTFQEASQLLKNTIITNKSYEALKFYDSISTFWYLDPPYLHAQNNHYYSVSKEEVFDHEKLRDFCLSLEGKFIQSNTDCEEIHSLYKDFYVYPIKVPSNLNISGYSAEVLISNYPLDLQIDWGYKERPEPKRARLDGDISLSALFGDEEI